MTSRHRVLCREEDWPPQKRWSILPPSLPPSKVKVQTSDQALRSRCGVEATPQLATCTESTGCAQKGKGPWHRSRRWSNGSEAKVSGLSEGSYSEIRCPKFWCKSTLVSKVKVITAVGESYIDTSNGSSRHIKTITTNISAECGPASCGCIGSGCNCDAEP